MNIIYTIKSKIRQRWWRYIRQTKGYTKGLIRQCLDDTAKIMSQKMVCSVCKNKDGLHATDFKASYVDDKKVYGNPLYNDYTTKIVCLCPKCGVLQVKLPIE